MHDFYFDALGDAPIVPAVISTAKGKRKLELVLDTGAEGTQFHRRTMMRLGCGEELKTRSAKAIGVGGSTETGCVVRLPRFALLGSVADDFEVAVFDMTYLGEKNIDGLIGWDLIRLLHLEMDGPHGMLRIYCRINTVHDQHSA